MATLIPLTDFGSESVGTDLNDIDAAWLERTGTGGSQVMEVINNNFNGASIQPAVINTNGASTYDSAVIDFPEDQWAEGHARDYQNQFSAWAGVGLHMSNTMSDSLSIYYFGKVTAANTAYLLTMNGTGIGILTSTAHSIDIPYTASVRIELQGGMQVGGILKGFIDDVEILSYVLTAPDLFPSTGNPGFFVQDDSGSNEPECGDAFFGDFLAAPVQGLVRDLVRPQLYRSGLVRPDLDALPHNFDEFI